MPQPHLDLRPCCSSVRPSGRKTSHFARPILCKSHGRSRRSSQGPSPKRRRPARDCALGSSMGCCERLGSKRLVSVVKLSDGWHYHSEKGDPDFCLRWRQNPFAALMGPRGKSVGKTWQISVRLVNDLFFGGVIVFWVQWRALGSARAGRTRRTKKTRRKKRSRILILRSRV